ncbi:hypothetical protein C8J56DRAFT_1048901 [Mycena floridula]|nr:hypothetical protein C8J56DRAFT_1048901 [Mycena floridula]
MPSETTLTRCTPRRDSIPSDPESEDETLCLPRAPGALGGPTGGKRKRNSNSSGKKRGKRARIADEEESDADTGTGTVKKPRNFKPSGPIDEPQLASVDTRHALLHVTQFSTDARTLPVLKSLIDHLLNNPGKVSNELSLSEESSLGVLGKHCQKLESQDVVNEYALFVTLVQLRIETQRRIDIAKASCTSLASAQVRLEDFAAEVTEAIGKDGIVITREQFNHWLRQASIDPSAIIVRSQLIPLLEDIRFYIGKQHTNIFFRLSFGDVTVPFHNTADITKLLQRLELGWIEQPPPHQRMSDYLNRDILSEYQPTFLSENLPPLVPIPMQESQTLTLKLEDFALNTTKTKITETWTDIQREKAASAKKVETYDELANFVKGIRINSDDYVYLDTAILEGRKLHIVDRKQSTQPSITAKVSLLEPQFRHISKDDKEECFPAFHAINFGRYSAKGHKVPDDIHPPFYKTIGTKMNFTQRFPSESKLMKENPESTKARDPIFHYVHRALEHLMKTGLVGLNDRLEITAQSLPLNDTPAAYPYTGYIININVTTRGHKDPNDKLLCIVIGFGDFEGGEIIFDELGLVIKFQPLDIVVFPSKDITHFNLRFSGMRGSLVMSTDKALDAWAEDKNGWGGKNFKKDIFRWEDVLVISSAAA